MYTKYIKKYRVPVLQVLEVYIELLNKRKFYKSIIGRLFFDGWYNLINIEYAIKVIKRCDAFNNTFVVIVD